MATKNSQARASMANMLKRFGDYSSTTFTKSNRK
jgi:hypothetical protein